MPGKRNGPKGWRESSSASPVRMTEVKPALVELPFPTVEIGARRSNTLATTPFRVSCTQRLAKALCGESLAMNRARKRTGHLHGLTVSRASMRDRLSGASLVATEFPESPNAEVSCLRQCTVFDRHDPGYFHKS